MDQAADAADMSAPTTPATDILDSNECAVSDDESSAAEAEPFADITNAIQDIELNPGETNDVVEQPPQSDLDEQPVAEEFPPPDVFGSVQQPIAVDEEACCLACGASIRAGMIRCRECGTRVMAAPPSHEPVSLGIPDDESATVEQQPAEDSTSSEFNKDLICSVCGAPVRENMLRCRECGYFVVARERNGPANFGRPGRRYYGHVDELESSASQGPYDATAVEHRESAAESTTKASLSASALPKRRVWQIVAAAMTVLSLAALAAGGYSLLPEKRAAEFRVALSSAHGPFNTILFAPRDGQLICGGTDGQVVVWGNFQSEPELLKPLTHRPILALATAPDGFLAASDDTGKVFGWNLNGGEASSITDFSHPVTVIVFRYTKAGRAEAILGTTRGELNILSPSGKQVLDSKHRGGVKRGVYLTRADLLVTAGTNGNLVWRETESQRVLLIVREHDSEVSGLAATADETLIASGDWNGRVTVWNVRKRERLANFQFDSGISGLAFYQKRYLISADWNGTLWFLPLSEGLPSHRIDTGSVLYGLSVSPDGKTIATISDRPQVDLWEVPAEIR